jgi:signal transduction histidine kinase
VELNRIALRSARTLLSMVNDLLDISKLESGSLRLDRATVTPEALVAAAVEQVEPLLRERGLALEQDLPTDLPRVGVDADLVGRVLVNLLGNAIKFTPRGGTLRIGAVAEGDWLAIRVTDTGEGIPPEYHATIFEKFGQVRTTSSKKARSTGLGLTFCKMAVEAHGGAIRVESTPGAGSTFTFTLPSELTEPDEPCAVGGQSDADHHACELSTS